MSTLWERGRAGAAGRSRGERQIGPTPRHRKMARPGQPVRDWAARHTCRYHDHCIDAEPTPGRSSTTGRRAADRAGRAGTSKTRVITHRIAFLIDDRKSTRRPSSDDHKQAAGMGYVSGSGVLIGPKGRSGRDVDVSRPGRHASCSLSGTYSGARCNSPPNMPRLVAEGPGARVDRHATGGVEPRGRRRATGVQAVAHGGRAARLGSRRLRAIIRSPRRAALLRVHSLDNAADHARGHRCG